MPYRQYRVTPVRIAVVAGLVALAVLLALDASLYAQDHRAPANEIRLSAIQWFSWGTLLTTGPGFNQTVGAPVVVVLDVTDCELFCGPFTATHAWTSTTGFSVLSSNLPVTVAPGATANVTVTLSGPSSDFAGLLAIELSR